MLQSALQAASDTGIHITMSGAIVTLVAKAVYDEIRKKKNGNSNGSSREMVELSENMKLQTKVLDRQTGILEKLSQDVAVMLDRTDRMK